ADDDGLPNPGRLFRKVVMTKTLVRSLVACVVFVVVAGVWSLASRAQDRPTATAKLELNQGDRIAIVGGAFAEYLQHEGWLETLIQGRFPDKELVVRNLAHAGDELTVQIRVDGFGSQDEWLKRTKADVVFGF